MACNINRLKTRRDEGRACSPCDDAYPQTRVLTRCPHTQSPGPLISVFIFDIKLHGGAIMATMSLPEEGGIMELKFSKRVLIIAVWVLLAEAQY